MKPSPAPSPLALDQSSAQSAHLLSTGAHSASVKGGPATVRTASLGSPGATNPMGRNRVRRNGGVGHSTNANLKVVRSQPVPLKESSTPDAVPVFGTAPKPTALQTSANRWAASRIIRKRGNTSIHFLELVDSKVTALLNRLTTENFDSISDKIIAWANKSKHEKDGRTLIHVIRLVFEKATDEAAWSEMYARLCRKMMETISPEVQDDGIRNSEGKPIAGGQLFRKYLLNRCQDDFERGWVAKETTAAAAAAKAHDDQAVSGDKGDETELYSDAYYVAQKARRQGLGLIKFIGELFKLRMLTERIMHECVKKLLGNVGNPEEIESLCQLLKTVGQLLDVPKARAHMDVYFSRMKECCKSPNISPRMQFMLQDVIELRDRKWVARSPVIALLPPALEDGVLMSEVYAWHRHWQKIDIKEFFAVRSMEEASVYFMNLPEEHHSHFISRLMGSALESKEEDVVLVAGLFSQIASKGQCSPGVFEAGFMPVTELLDDIVIDAPNAFKFMAVMLKGAGFDENEERLARVASKLMDSKKLLRLLSS